jgi:hypothetical protein
MPINPPAPKSRTADLSRSVRVNATTLWFVLGVFFGVVIVLLVR